MGPPGATFSAQNFRALTESPGQPVGTLIAKATLLGFDQGQNLLENALGQFNRGNVKPACNMVNAFINQVQAQSGKQLTAAQASELIDGAMEALTIGGC
jgi:hypothetical protein